MSVNNVNTVDVYHGTAVNALKDAGARVHLAIRRLRHPQDAALYQPPEVAYQDTWVDIKLVKGSKGILTNKVFTTSFL